MRSATDVSKRRQYLLSRHTNTTPRRPPAPQRPTHPLPSHRSPLTARSWTAAPPVPALLTATSLTAINARWLFAAPNGPRTHGRPGAPGDGSTCGHKHMRAAIDPAPTGISRHGPGIAAPKDGIGPSRSRGYGSGARMGVARARVCRSWCGTGLFHPRLDERGNPRV